MIQPGVVIPPGELVFVIGDVMWKHSSLSGGVVTGDVTWKHSSLSGGVVTERGRRYWAGRCSSGGFSSLSVRTVIWFSRDRMRSSWLLLESIRWQVAASSYNLSLCESKQQQLKNSDSWFSGSSISLSKSQRPLAASNLHRLWSLDVLIQASTHLQGPALVNHTLVVIFSFCLFLVNLPCACTWKRNSWFKILVWTFKNLFLLV